MLNVGKEKESKLKCKMDKNIFKAFYYPFFGWGWGSKFLSLPLSNMLKTKLGNQFLNFFD